MNRCYIVLTKDNEALPDKHSPAEKHKSQITL